MVDINELAEAGLTMRTAQKQYFRTRQNKWLSEAKEAEARFDALLARMAPANVALTAGLAEQGRLFG